MTEAKKTKKLHKIELVPVTFYALDRTFKDTGKFSISTEISVGTKKGKDLQEALKHTTTGKFVIDKTTGDVKKDDNGDKLIRITASSYANKDKETGEESPRFVVLNKESEVIKAPAKFSEDRMVVSLLVSEKPYNYEGKKGISLTLEKVMIVSHDTAERTGLAVDPVEEAELMAQMQANVSKQKAAQG
jgi:hypothetical protein